MNAVCAILVAAVAFLATNHVAFSLAAGGAVYVVLVLQGGRRG